MELPRAVVEQGRRADELLAKHGKTGQPAPAQATPPAPATPEAPKEPAAPAAAAPATPPAQTPAQVNEWEQRYKVLQGKYNAEVARAQAEAKAAEEARKAAEERAAALAAEARKKPLVSEEEVKEFGEPLVDLARRIAREENRAVVDENEKLKKRLEEVGAQVTQTQQVGQHLNTQAFFDALTVKQPGWETVNDSPEFQKWIGEVDPLTGEPRQAALDRAQDALDATRVAAFFAAFTQSIQTRAAPQQAALEAQVTPSAPSSSTSASVPEKKIWTPGLISKFYDDVRRGLINDADAARIELDIQAAAREGRYKPR